MPKKIFAGLMSSALIALMALSAQAAEKAAEDKAAADAAKLGIPVVSYYPLAPEIVTNYTASPRHLGHVRIRASIVVSDTADVDAVKKYDAVIRDTLISILNESTAEDFERIADEMKDLVITRLSEVTDGRKIFCDSDGGIIGNRQSDSSDAS